MRKKKYCDQETVFEHVWNNCDDDGLWVGDTASVAEKFGVSRDEAHSALDDLVGRKLIEQLYLGKYAIVRWRGKEDTGEEEVTC
jgi:hypothetical protein